MFLDKLALKYKSDKSSQGHSYTQYYDFVFDKIKKQSLKILEIGVQSGGSLKMWKEYFPNSLIYGIDIDPNCKKIEEDRIKIFIGSQADPVFLKDTKEKIKDDIDIIIDDGSHQSYHQIESLKILFPYVRPGGYYIIEDLHTSYRKKFNKGSTTRIMTYLYTLIDDMNLNGKTICANKIKIVEKLEKQKIALNYYEKNIEYILMFSGLCVIKKIKRDIKTTTFFTSQMSIFFKTLHQHMTDMIEKFKKKQKKIIFWHNYLVNDWKELISDQFETLYKSGLYDAVDKVCCGVVGIQPCLDEYSVFIKELVSSYTTNNKIEIRTSIENSFEYITLNWLKEYCNSNDAYVLYFHIKGISHPIGSITRPFEDDWRKYLEYFNIEKWQDCIKKLDEKFDCCGIGYRKRKKFIGNFWWANSNYIKKLIPVSNVLLNKDKRIVALRRRRYFYENWLFKYNPNKWTTFTPNIYCFYSRVGIYKGQRRLLPKEYKDEK